MSISISVEGVPAALRSGVKLMIKKVLAVVILSSGLVLASCNTVRGAGEDVESVADAADRIDD